MTTSKGPDTPLPPVRATAASLQLIRDNVPTELLAYPGWVGWVGWGGRRREEGKLDKTPLNAHNCRKAKTNVAGTCRLGVGQDKIRDPAREGCIPSVQVGRNGRRFDWLEVLTALRAKSGITAAKRECTS